MYLLLCSQDEGINLKELIAESQIMVYMHSKTDDIDKILRGYLFGTASEMPWGVL